MTSDCHNPENRQLGDAVAQVQGEMACLPSQPAGVIIVKMSFNIFIPFQYQLTDDDAQQQVLEEQQQLAQVLSRNKISPLFILF